jgi:hypothetical protein
MTDYPITPLAGLKRQWRKLASFLREGRRPKPPSLKEQGLQALEALQQRTTDPSIVEPLRRALEALPDD